MTNPLPINASNPIVVTSRIRIKFTAPGILAALVRNYTEVSDSKPWHLNPGNIPERGTIVGLDALSGILI